MAARRRMRGPDRAHRYKNTARLRAAVTRQCETEFREAFGKDWTPELGTRLGRIVTHGGQRRDTERKAQAVFRTLRKAMLEAETFVAEQTESRGGIAGFLSWWVPEHISPLVQHAAMERDWTTLDDQGSDRSRLVWELDRKDLLGLGRRPDGSSRFLDVRELAMVSLLLGNWPDKVARNATVAEAIEAESDNISRHMKRHGQPPMDVEHGIAPKRGPKPETTRRR